jgi:hypothetical protein
MSIEHIYGAILKKNTYSTVLHKILHNHVDNSIQGVYLVGEGAILVTDQPDGGKKTSNFHTGKCIQIFSP